MHESISQIVMRLHTKYHACMHPHLAMLKSWCSIREQVVATNILLLWLTVGATLNLSLILSTPRLVLKNGSEEVRVRCIT
jgi:hypothetical protein